MKIFKRFGALLAGVALFTGSLFAGSVQGEKFGGIGVQLAEKNNEIVITRVLKDSPAESKGILSGDILVSIEGENVKSLSMREVIAKMRGDAGTALGLEVRRSSKFVSFEVIRVSMKLHQASINQLGMQGNEVLYRSEILREFDAEARALLFVNNTEVEGTYLKNPEKGNSQVFSVELGSKSQSLVEGPFSLQPEGLNIELPESGEFQLEVYNAKGELVKNSLMNAESSIATVNLEAIAGARFLVVRQGEFLASLKHHF